MKLKFILPLSLIFILTTLIYFQSFSYYFLQDDWYVLNQINKKNVLFYYLPQSKDYYRPLSLETFFWLSHKLFGLNPLGYHLIPFVIHLVNTTLLFFLLFRIFKSKLAAFVGSFVSATASFNYMAISWPAAAWSIFGAFFILQALNYYLLYLSSRKLILLIIIYILFLLSILSTEFAIMLPVFFIIFTYFFLNKKILDIYKHCWWLIFMLFTDIIYLLIRVVVFPISTTGVYQPQFNTTVFRTFFWYFIWALNIPEDIKYQIIFSKFQLTSTIIKDGTVFLLPTLTTALFTMISFFVLIYKSKLHKRIIVGTLLIFTLFILPVIFLPNHTFPYYLTLPFLGLVLLISKSVSLLQKQTEGLLLIMSFTIMWFFSSFLSVTLNRQLHWVSKEQAFSKDAIAKVQKTLPNSIATNSTILLLTRNCFVKPSLSDQNALQVIFKDLTIKTIYQESNFGLEKFDYQVKL